MIWDLVRLLLSVPFIHVFTLLLLCVGFVTCWLLEQIVRYARSIAFSLPEPDSDSRPGIDGAIALLGFMFGHPVSIFILEAGKDRLYFWSLRTGVYTLIAVPLLGAIVGMIISTSHRPQGDARQPGMYRTFDRATIRFATWVLAWGLILFITVPAIAWWGKLPTQTEKVSLTPKIFEKYKFNYDKSYGIKFYTFVGPNKFEQGVPDNLNVTVSLGENVNQNWEITDVEGHILPQKQDEEPEPLPRTPSLFNTHAHRIGESSSVTVFLRDLEALTKPMQKEV